MTIEAVLAVLSHLDTALALLEKALAASPTKEGLGGELAAREERLAQMRAGLSEAQAADQALLDARLPR